jgi:predicted phosphodiesterase
MKSPPERVTRIAHISDLHIDAAGRHGARASRVVEHLAGVVITGDLTQDGLDREYEALAEVLDPLSGVLPVFFCPGNHDDRGLVSPTWTAPGSPIPRHSPTRWPATPKRSGSCVAMSIRPYVPNSPRFR